MKRLFANVVVLTCALSVTAVTALPARAADVRIKELGRFLGWRDNMLIGYGLVSGLAGTGDTPRSRATRQALSNIYSQFDLMVPEEQISSRNVAIVMITAVLPAAADVGDKIDVTVTSAGDARSLTGGTLVMTPLRGPDKRTYALAQGPISVGGYRYDANGNLLQKNHPTVGMIPSGANVEVPVTADLLSRDGYLTFVLKDADSMTAERIAQKINSAFGPGTAISSDASNIRIRAQTTGGSVNTYVSDIEALSVTPDDKARVIINERTGTVVAGGNVRISAVAVSQGDIRITVTTENYASQPNNIVYAGARTRSLIVSNSQLSVEEPSESAVISLPNTTVTDLVQSLARLHVTTRDMISILQAIKSAGALYADLIIQ